MAALGFSHEANTFAKAPVGIEFFRGPDFLRGAEITARHSTAHTTMAGYLSMSRDSDIQVEPLAFAGVPPAGPLTADAFDYVTTVLLDALGSGGQWDGVLLALHGAAVADLSPDADGELLARVRAAVGASVPIGVCLDLHANISPAMAGAADIMATYRTNPHVDADDRARAVGDLVVAAARGSVHPVLALQQVPVAMNILRQNTAGQPMQRLLAYAAEIEARDRILSVSLAEGYPYADVPEMGMSVVVVADDDHSLARQCAVELAGEVWDARDEATGTAPTVHEGVQAACRSAATPLLLLDVGDNIGGGAPGTSVVVLDELCAQGASGVVSILTDPTLAATCHSAGPGAAITLDLHDPEHRTGTVIDGTVACLSDGRFEDPGHTHGGDRYFDSGPTALVTYGDECDLVVTSRAIMPSSLEQLRSLGIDPSAKRIIVAKGVQSPLTAYGSVVRSVIPLDSPGVTCADLHRFTYSRRRLPLFPFEDIEWP